jgi:formate--tetrahydrofolate ligase
VRIWAPRSSSISSAAPRDSGPTPRLIVATIRALKHHGGVPETPCGEDADAVSRGLPNLLRHIKNMVRDSGCPRSSRSPFPDRYRRGIRGACAKRAKRPASAAVWSEVWARGGEGALNSRTRSSVSPSPARRSGHSGFAYELDRSLEGRSRPWPGKLRAGGVEFAPRRRRISSGFHDLGYGGAPGLHGQDTVFVHGRCLQVCAPSGFALTVPRGPIVRGAEFVVALAGDIMRGPAWPRSQARSGSMWNASAGSRGCSRRELQGYQKVTAAFTASGFSPGI